MRFLHLLRQPKFHAIQGYDDVKDIISRALDCNDSFNLLLCGPPASSKTLFLLGIQDLEHKAVYFDDLNSTNRILDVLEEERPRIILIDELDKLPRQFQHKLLNFLESGHVKVDQKNCSYDFEIKNAKVFATANEIGRLSKPLQSRFRRLFLPPYTEVQFGDVAVKLCPKLKESTACAIGSVVWKQHGNIMDVISISKLISKNDGPDEIEKIMKTLIKYGDSK